MTIPELKQWIEQRKVLCPICMGRTEDDFGSPCVPCRGDGLLPAQLLLEELNSGLEIRLTDKLGKSVTISPVNFHAVRSMCVFVRTPFMEAIGDTHGA